MLNTLQEMRWLMQHFLEEMKWFMMSQNSQENICTCTVPLKDKRTQKRVKGQRVGWKNQRIFKLIFFQRVRPLLFCFDTFALCCRDVKKRLQFDHSIVNSASKQR